MVKDFNTFVFEELNQKDKALVNSIIAKEIEVGDDKDSISGFEMQNGTYVDSHFLKYAIENSDTVDTYKAILYKKYGETAITTIDMNTFIIYYNNSKI